MNKKIDFEKLFDMLGNDTKIMRHKKIPTIKRVDYRSVCVHGFMWGEGERIPCLKCLEMSKEVYTGKSSLLWIEKMELKRYEQENK